jgi:hypothetical protein
MAKEKAKASKFGLMALSMLDSGEIIKQTEMEFYIMQMGISMKENG